MRWGKSMNIKIDPLCNKDNNFFFARSDGIFLPCCWCSDGVTVKKFLGDKHDQLDVNKHSIDDILSSSAWQMLMNKINSSMPFEFCKTICAVDNKTQELPRDGVGLSSRSTF